MMLILDRAMDSGNESILESARDKLHKQLRTLRISIPVKEEFAAVSNMEQLELLLSKPKEFYDVIYVPNLMSSIEYDRWALQILHRLLKPKGYIIFEVTNKLSPIGCLS